MLKSELHSRIKERAVGALDDGSEVVEQIRDVPKVRMIPDVGSVGGETDGLGVKLNAGTGSLIT